jgi:hypothetical protein
MFCCMFSSVVQTWLTILPYPSMNTMACGGVRWHADMLDICHAGQQSTDTAPRVYCSMGTFVTMKSAGQE